MRHCRGGGAKPERRPGMTKGAGDARGERRVRMERVVRIGMVMVLVIFVEVVGSETGVGDVVMCCAAFGGICRHICGHMLPLRVNYEV